MAVEVLAENATTLAAASWYTVSGSGGSGFAADATLIINRGAQSIQAGLVPTTATTGGASYLDILPTSANVIGGTGGSLKYDFCKSDTAATPISRVRNWAGGGALYLEPTGTTATPNSQCNYLEMGYGSSTYVTGGAIKNAVLEGGAYFELAAAATAAASGVWTFTNGRSLINYHASNEPPTVNVTGGNHIFRRPPSALTISGGTLTLEVLDLDCTSITMNGGTIIWKSHNATGPTLTAVAGVLDFSQIDRPVTFTGAILGPGLRIIPNPLVTFTSPVRRGSGPQGLAA